MLLLLLCAQADNKFVQQLPSRGKRRTPGRGEGKNTKGKDLYEFWGTDITESINESISTHKNKTILNLASVEYFSSVKQDSLEGNVVSPIFKDYKNGNYKIISFFAKKARGQLATYIIKNRITSPEKIKGFDIDGYAYNEELSKGNNWIFSRVQD